MFNKLIQQILKLFSPPAPKRFSMSLNISKALHEDILEVGERHNLSDKEVLRAFLKIGRLVEMATSDGATFFLEEPDGTIKRVLVFQDESEESPELEEE